VLSNAVAAPAATVSALITMAGLALVLGCTGVYGVLSFLVSKQVRDFAIRFALGARRSNVFWQVMRQGGTLCLTGVAIGSAGAVAFTRWMSSELHDVSATDPATYAAVAVAVSLVTFVACLVPTLRAMSTDPLVLLREQ
jgi:putative ABC transport system permease protein